MPWTVAGEARITETGEVIGDTSVQHDTLQEAIIHFADTLTDPELLEERGFPRYPNLSLQITASRY
jgi:hypothetical protein